MKSWSSPYCPRAAAWLLALLACAASSHAADRKPNFLFVYTDDQRWDAMGVVQREQGERARFPWFKSPSMDRLAAEGVRFRNAFVTLSLCSPSRAAFLTGRYNHLNGVANNHTPFPEDSVTHATLLRAAGYRTAYIGKWHMGNQRGQRPGFDYSASFIAHGRYQDCPVEVNGVSTSTKGWIDDVSTDFAIEWIKQNRDRPFSIVVGFKSPHSPRGGANLPERLRNLYPGETSRAVPNMSARAIFHGPAPEGGGKAHPLAANAVHLDYLRHVAGADENLGRLLDALDQLGLAEDTVVVYASDNGYYLGEHGLGDKRSIYEESLRIPLLVRYPRLFGKGKVVDEMVLNIDLAPTFLELAGVAVPPEMQGRSWKALAAGQKPANWRQSFLAEYFFENGGGDTPTLVGVRTANAKLVQYPGHPEWTEVFDLAVDPYELKNLAADPTARAKLSAELDEQVKAVNYAVPPYADKPGPRAAKAASAALDSNSESERQQRIQWWREARFGMFIHWGLYAIPGGVWKDKVHKQGYSEWIMFDEKIPVREYEQLAAKFNPVQFDARAWAAVARQAGMKYMVLTAKHHDGFSMFKSSLTPYNIADATPFKRDVAGELAEACRDAGLRFGCYYSIDRDWYRPQGPGNRYKQANVWDYPDSKREDFDRYFATFAKPQVEELLTKYRPDVLWFDEIDMKTDAQVEDLYQMVRRLRPECLINSRIKGCVPPKQMPPPFCDYLSTGDNEIAGKKLNFEWENPGSMNTSYGFNANDHNWVSAPEIVSRLVEIVSKGGNYLLNVGPTPEGLIPQPCVERLTEVGRWIERNGEAIYGSSAWRVCDEEDEVSGGVNRFTAKRDFLYVFCPAGRAGELIVKALGTGRLPDQEIVSVAMLGSSEKIAWSRTPGGLKLTLPATAGGDFVTTLRVGLRHRPGQGEPSARTQ